MPFVRIASLRVEGWMVLVALGLGLAACSGEKDSTPAAPLASATSSEVRAVVAVERAMVFPLPDRNAEPVTYLYQRESVPVRGQTADSVFLLTTVNGADGWILRAQVEISGSLAAVPQVSPVGLAALPSPTASPSATPTLTPLPGKTLLPTLAQTAVPTVTGLPTRTPLPTRTALPTLTATSENAPDAAEMPLAEGGTPDPNAIPTGPAIKAGEPPPLTITLPEGWKAVHILVPFRSVNSIRDVPLSIYTGPLPGGVTGYIYLFWGFPNVVTPGGDLNLWADGLQILRGALVDQSCNLGIDRTQHPYRVGGREAVGTTYTAVACEGETDTAGWFAVLRVDNGSYAFYTAVEPLASLPEQVMNLQAILDSVAFLPPPTP